MISVVIPTFNREKTIKRAVDSVLAQTYQDIEVIIVDDCSTDDTEKIIKTYNNPRVKYVKLEKNSGACVARNTGVELARGEYIAFQDSDDFWKKEKLEKQLQNMKDNNSDIDFCMINVIGEEEDKINIKPTKTDMKNISKYGVKKALCYQSFISTQSAIGKAECIKSISFDISLPRLQDYDLFIRLAGMYKISVTKEPLVDLYIQDDSISKKPHKLIAALEIMDKKNYDFTKNEKKIFKSSIYKILGDSYIGIDKKKTRSYYIDSLKNRFQLKVFVKLLREAVR